MNLQHVHFLFYATLNIVDIGKFTHKIISVTFFLGTTEVSFLIFGTEHQNGELYCVTQFWICGMSTSCLTWLSIFKRKEVGRRHMSSLEDLLLNFHLFFKHQWLGLDYMYQLPWLVYWWHSTCCFWGDMKRRRKFCGYFIIMIHVFELHLEMKQCNLCHTAVHVHSCDCVIWKM